MHTIICIKVVYYKVSKRGFFTFSPFSFLNMLPFCKSICYDNVLLQCKMVSPAYTIALKVESFGVETLREQSFGHAHGQY